jgi:hypothetical protein
MIYCFGALKCDRVVEVVLLNRITEHMLELEASAAELSEGKDACRIALKV